MSERLDPVLLAPATNDPGAILCTPHDSPDHATNRRATCE